MSGKHHTGIVDQIRGTARRECKDAQSKSQVSSWPRSHSDKKPAAPGPRHCHSALREASLAHLDSPCSSIPATTTSEGVDQGAGRQCDDESRRCHPLEISRSNPLRYPPMVAARSSICRRLPHPILVRNP